MDDKLETFRLSNENVNSDVNSDAKDTFLNVANACNKETDDSYYNGDILSNRTLYKNLAVVSVSFLLLFTAYLSLQSLQSSLNIEEGLGPLGLTVIYCSLIVSSLFLPPLAISRLGMKWTMVLSMFAYIGYLAASFHAVWATIMPTSVALGLGAGTLWSSKMAYVNELSRRYSLMSGKDMSQSKDRFFGIFFATYHTGDIWGNLASSLTFSKRAPENTTLSNSSCGISFCPQEESGNANLFVSDKTKIYIYSGFCLGCAVLAVVLMTSLLDNLKAPQGKEASSLKLLTLSIRHLLNSRYQWLLVPVTIYRGYSQASIVSDFTVAFTSCILGVENVGFTMICFGVSCSVSSFLFGRLTRWTGYIIPFLIGFILHGAVCIVLFTWNPSKDVPYVFYICVTLWGIGYSVYSSLLSAVYSNLFQDNIDAAISCFRVFDSVGWALAFGLSSFLCTGVKVVTVIVLLILSTVLVTVVLFHDKRLRLTQHYAQTKAQISFAVTVFFDFATLIVQTLHFLIPNSKLLAFFYNYTGRFVSGLVGNPEDRFSRVVAQIFILSIKKTIG